ncbi:MAG: hypothetical protein ACOC7T_00075 [Planctomycetota bacterium]
MNPEHQDDETPEEDQAHAASLVPFYGGTEIVRGIQAIRRGDAVLYTVRGEPSEVRELIGQLDREGVGEVIALISHRLEEALPPEEEEGEEQAEE